jgi:type II secretory pathway pseudopilin PulG
MSVTRPPWCLSPRSATGFTYLGLLFFIAIMGFALASVAIVWHTSSKREKEAELLFIGDEFRRAIESYRTSSPGAAQFPPTLDDLLRDPRFPEVRRHLRRVYRDPVTGQAEWGLVKQPDERIVGVYSLSEEVPKKTDGFPTEYAQFAKAASYRDWKFIDAPSAAPSGEDAKPTGPATGSAVPPNTVPEGVPLPAGQSVPGAPPVAAGRPLPSAPPARTR